jgi:ribosomal protein S18 acetylase RimI-like enzyme
MNEPIIRALELDLAAVAALLAVERVSLEDSQYTPEEALAVLQQPDHWAYVACDGEQIAGFLFCFATQWAEGAQLELDMLGVAPDYRRRGLATRLVTHACGQAAERGIVPARAVVERENDASRRAFQRAGLQVVQRAQMIVYEIGGCQPIAFLPDGWRWQRTQEGALAVEGAQLAAFGRNGWLHWLTDAEERVLAAAESQRVDTLSYRGVWIERLWATDARAGRVLARAVVEQAKADDLDEVGYLQPTPAAGSVWPLWEREGFVLVGAYDVLRR